MYTSGLVAREGLEPSTSALWELRSDHLSYLAKLENRLDPDCIAEISFENHPD